MYGDSMSLGSSTSQHYKVGIVGASGYTGVELLRLLAGHPFLELVVATGDSKAGTAIADLYPSLAGHYKDQKFQAFEPEDFDGLDLAFIGLPHGLSMDVVPRLRGKVGKIIDLGSDFRLTDPKLYPQWYGANHTHPELLGEFVYGLPELFRDQLIGAELIAATGCNAATSTLALTPFVDGGYVKPEGLIVDLKTGVSGAGRPPKETTTYCTVSDNVAPYAVLTHRHTPEIEQAITARTGTEVSVLFTPHLVPANRGILATCYAEPKEPMTSEQAIEILADFYHGEPFVVVNERVPTTKVTVGSNTVHMSARVDPRTGRLITMASLDNLMKGASGMAIQNANLALQLPEDSGLTTIGVYP